jgi:hypothetical protein
MRSTTAVMRAAAAAYDAQKHLLLVVGGNGFVGSNILQRAVQKGIEVRSLNKSGKPQWQDVPWIDQVDWHQGSVFNPEDLAKAVDGATGVSTSLVWPRRWIARDELTVWRNTWFLTSLNCWRLWQQ